MLSQFVFRMYTKKTHLGRQGSQEPTKLPVNDVFRVSQLVFSRRETVFILLVDPNGTEVISMEMTVRVCVEGINGVCSMQKEDSIYCPALPWPAWQITGVHGSLKRRRQRDVD